MTVLPAEPASQVQQLLDAHGQIVSTALLNANHITAAMLRSHLDNGALWRVRHGVYVSGASWSGATPTERYRLSVAATLHGHPRWLASHHAALAMEQLPLLDVDLGRIDVVAAVGSSKRRKGVHVHRARPSQRERLDDPGTYAVSVADACVLTAAASGVRAGVVAIDAALQQRKVSLRDLHESLDSAQVRYGIRAARAAIAAADPRCESVGETLTRLLLVEAGFDLRTQVGIHDAEGFIGRVDFLVGDRVIVEFDGAVKYDGIDGKRALMLEKRREERLRDAGYRIVRVVWSELARPQLIVARIRQSATAA